MKNKLLIFIWLLGVNFIAAQEVVNVEVFKNQPVNFNGAQNGNKGVLHLQSGRLVVKKVQVPKFKHGSDVKIKLTLRSSGDRWDKSGSCFVITNPEQINVMSIAQGKEKFPKDSYIADKFGGVIATENYKPAVELLRFMTPFGVGHFSVAEDKHRRPVYIPKWEKQVVWEKDISQLESVLEGEFYIGVWIDTWTAEGYNFDLSLSYSYRPLPKWKVMPLVNTITYVEGQSLPDFFANQALDYKLNLPKNIKKAKLYYTVTGHGGHSEGDEFTKIKNSISFDGKLVLDTIPWRDDCASFRRFNPTSGVWLKKDSASYIDFKERKYKIKEIEERIASSDLSRSNWCPGSYVEPMVVELGALKSGTHPLKISIPATPANKEKLNHWLVSAYIIYQE